MRRVHVIPIGDKDLHCAQSTCWCHPLELHPTLWVHNAADCREKLERLAGDEYGRQLSEGWVNIGEMADPPAP